MNSNTRTHSQQQQQHHQLHRRSPRLLLAQQSSPHEQSKDETTSHRSKGRKRKPLGDSSNRNTTAAAGRSTIRKNRPRTKISIITNQQQSNSNNNCSNSIVNNDNSDDDDNNNKPLLDLGPLQKGILIKRPSATIKSPYVTDVKLLSTNDIILAHAPYLGVGGLCSPDSIVYLSQRPLGGKTSHAIKLVCSSSKKEEDDGCCLVGAHPRLGELLAEEILKRGLLKEEIGFGRAMVVKSGGG